MGKEKPQSKKEPQACPKCMAALEALKGKKGRALLEKYVVASTLWENAVLEGKKQTADWLRYEICRMLHGWTLDDHIRSEQEKMEGGWLFALLLRAMREMGKRWREDG